MATKFMVNRRVCLEFLVQDSFPAAMKIKAAMKSSPPHLAKERLDFHSPVFLEAKEAMEAHMAPAVAQGALDRKLPGLRFASSTTAVAGPAE